MRPSTGNNIFAMSLLWFRSFASNCSEFSKQFPEIPGDYALFRYNDSQISAPPARTRKGTMAMFTSCHPVSTSEPEQFINCPELSEAMVTPPKTTASLTPWMRPRSARVCDCASIVVAPMKAKFHPSPNRISARKKFGEGVVYR